MAATYVLITMIWMAAVGSLLLVAGLQVFNTRLERQAARHRFSSQPPPTRDPETVERWLES